jgi:molecular chaperone DnaK
VFSTAEDNQTAVTIRVFQGDRQIAEHNKYLGAFTLHGVAPAKRGVPQIEVTFEMDANGMLNVTAKDLGTGKQQNITIQHSSATSKEDIERMKAEAEQYAEEDRKKAELIEIKNKSENLIYNAESAIKESNVTEEIKKPIEEKVSNLKELLSSSSDAEVIQKAHDELMEQMGQLYSQQQQNNNPEQQNNEETTQSDNNQ